MHPLLAELAQHFDQLATREEILDAIAGLEEIYDSVSEVEQETVAQLIDELNRRLKSTAG